MFKTQSKSHHQTGKSDVFRDKQVRAMLPGRRESASGKFYYEHRANRSDKNPSRRL